MKILILEDDLERIKKFKLMVLNPTIAQTAIQAIEILKLDSIWDQVFLDHDLGGETSVDSNRLDTGMEVVRYICESHPIIKEIVVHSLNPVAANEMCNKLLDAGYKVHGIPFSKLLKLNLI